jgi:hypothetical protein
MAVLAYALVASVDEKGPFFDKATARVYFTMGGGELEAVVVQHMQKEGLARTIRTPSSLQYPIQASP